MRKVSLDVDMERFLNGNLILGLLVQLKIHIISIVELMPLVKMANEISGELSRVAPRERQANRANDWNNVTSVAAVAMIQQTLSAQVHFFTERTVESRLIRWARVVLFLKNLSILRGGRLVGAVAHRVWRQLEG